MKNRIILVIIVMLFTINLQAQVGINNANPDTTSMLDIKSTSKGILLPRMTSAERDIMSSFGNVPANSLLIFDTDLNQFCYYRTDLNKWISLGAWVHEAHGDSVMLFESNAGVSLGGDKPKAQLDLNGDYNKSHNIGGTKLLIHKYDNDGSVTYLIYCKDEQGKTDFFIKNRPSLSGDPTMYFAGKMCLGGTDTIPDKELDVTGDIKATGTVEANTFEGNGTIPIGGIIMWSGSIATIPAGWALCNGNTVNNHITPDLRNRFIVGAGSSYAVNDNGGTNAVTLTTGEMPSHNHPVIDPGHKHVYRTRDKYYHNMDEEYGGSSKDWIWSDADYINCNSNTTGITINTTGDGASHENRPPYYSLAYIMRTQ